TLIVSGVRLGTTRANTTGRPTRLVIDMDEGRVLLEEATGRTFVRDKDDTAGGAEASTQIEKLAQEEAARILEGPRAPRARFVPVSALSDPDDPGKGRPLGSGVQIARVQTEHDPEPLSRGRAYVRSEEHTSELQSRENLVCRLLLEKKKNSTHKDKSS